MNDAREVVERFLAAYYEGDATSARRFLHDDMEFRAPGGVTHSGAEKFLKAAAHVAPSVLGLEKHRVFEDGDDVCVIYDVLTKHRVGRFTVSEWYQLRDGKIAAIRNIFDTAPFVARKGNKGAETAVDPVCGMTVEKTEDASTRSHAGKTYWFCNPGCAASFEKQPSHYVPVGAPRP